MDEYTARLEPYRRILDDAEVDALMRKPEEELEISDIVSLCRNERYVRTRNPKTVYRIFPYQAIYNHLVELKKINVHALYMGNMGYR